MRTVVVTLGVALLLVACGSTVQIAPEDLAAGTAGTQQGELDQGLSLPESPSAEGPGAATDPGTPGGLPDVSGADGGATGTQAEDVETGTGDDAFEDAAGGSTNSDEGASEGASATGDAEGHPQHGVDDEAIYVGITYTNDGDEANEATGFESSTADRRDVYNALIDDLNRRGGLFDREIVPVYFRTRSTTTQTIEQQAQAACAHWHQDNQVFAVLGFPHPIVLDCTHQAGGIVIHNVLGTFSPDVFAQYSGFVEVGGMNAARQARVTIDGLHAQDYFEPTDDLEADTKVGILTYDTQGFRQAVDEVAKPALSRYGFEDPEVVYIQPPDSFQAVGDSAAQTQNAVLQFRSADVNRLLILEGAAGISGGGFLLFTFTNNAESQGYRPRYGLNSGNALNAVTPQTPEGQLDGALAVGWVDAYDVPRNEWLDNSEIRRCFAIMKEHGVPNDAFNAAYNRNYCSDVFFLEEALRRGGAPTRDAFINGVNSVGTSYTSTVTPMTRFAANQHDAVLGVRNVTHDSGCRCWHYTTDPYVPES